MFIPLPSILDALFAGISIQYWVSRSVTKDVRGSSAETLDGSGLLLSGSGSGEVRLVLYLAALFQN